MAASVPPPAGTDLDTLAARAAAGDGPAESALLSDVRERFLAIAKRRVREDEVEDCVQEALAIAHARYRTRKASVGILPWSLTVLRNVIGNTYQRRTRAEGHVPLPPDDAGAPHAPDVDPLAGIAGEALRARIVRAIRELERGAPRCAAIFRAILAGLAGGGGPEDAVRGAIGVIREDDPSVTRGNFHVILHRCRARLRRALEGASP